MTTHTQVPCVTDGDLGVTVQFAISIANRLGGVTEVVGIANEVGAIALVGNRVIRGNRGSRDDKVVGVVGRWSHRQAISLSYSKVRKRIKNGGNSNHTHNARTITQAPTRKNRK